jgi:hypothetical protein
MAAQCLRLPCGADGNGNGKWQIAKYGVRLSGRVQRVQTARGSFRRPASASRRRRLPHCEVPTRIARPGFAQLR